MAIDVKVDIHFTLFDRILFYPLDFLRSAKVIETNAFNLLFTII